jgi:hypothetical protein
LPGKIDRSLIDLIDEFAACQHFTHLARDFQLKASQDRSAATVIGRRHAAAEAFEHDLFDKQIKRSILDAVTFGDARGGGDRFGIDWIIIFMRHRPAPYLSSP